MSSHWFPFLVPDKPTNLHGEATSPNTVQLNWEAPITAANSILSYELYYNESNSHKNVRITISPPETSYLLDDLTPNTVYHIRVSAKSERGEGTATRTIQVRTKEYGMCYFFHHNPPPPLQSTFEIL